MGIYGSRTWQVAWQARDDQARGLSLAVDGLAGRSVDRQMTAIVTQGQEAGSVPSKVAQRQAMLVGDGSRLVAKDDALPTEKSTYRWISAYAAALVAARLEFGGDLDRLLIYLVFVQAELSWRASGRNERMNGINALSVADITLVPRETTRRKLNDLARSGHIRREADGLWYLDDTVRCGLWTEAASAVFDLEFQKRLQR